MFNEAVCSDVSDIIAIIWHISQYMKDNNREQVT